MFQYKSRANKAPSVGTTAKPKPEKVKEEEVIESFVADKTEEETTTDMSAASDKTLGE